MQTVSPHGSPSHTKSCEIHLPLQHWFPALQSTPAQLPPPLPELPPLPPLPLEPPLPGSLPEVLPPQAANARARGRSSARVSLCISRTDTSVVPALTPEKSAQNPACVRRRAGERNPAAGPTWHNRDNRGAATRASCYRVSFAVGEILACPLRLGRTTRLLPGLSVGKNLTKNCYAEICGARRLRRESSGIFGV